MKRRDVLASLALALAAGPVAAIEPFVRPQPGPLKLSLAAYSFREELTPDGDTPAAMTLFDLVDFCRQHGVPGVELTSYYFPPGFDEPYLRKLARYCHTSGVSISGGAIRNDFCVPEDRRDEQLTSVRRWIDAYAILGAPVIRVFAGKVPKGATLQQGQANCIAATQIACDYAASRGVMLALENHGGITATPEMMLPIVQGVSSPAFGVNFDSGNFRTEDPYADLAKIAPYAVNAQIKTEIGPKESPQPADFDRIVGILRDAGYGGWVALEYEEGGDTAAAVVKHLAELRTALG